MNFCLIGAFFLLFFLPNLILNFLQYRHISRAMQSRAILLSPKDYIEAGEYALAKLRLEFVSDCVNFALFGVWILWGIAWLNQIFSHWSNMYLLNQVLSVLVFLLIWQIVSSCLKYYQVMVIDEKFGFNKQTKRLFALDFFKGLGLTLIVGGVVLYGLIFLIETFNNWWLWSAIFIWSIVIVINFLYPTLIAPLFNTFIPLQDSLLQEKIEKLMKSVGFESSGVFVMDASKRDGRLNAYFCGLGKNKRVVLFDTLLEKISSEGLMAILGHELGHFKHRDLVFNVLIQGVFLFGVFFLVGSLSNGMFNTLGLEKNSSNLLIFLFLFSPLISFWFLPIVGFFSRKAEFRADSFGASLSSKKTLAEALVRLVNENKSFPSSHPLYIGFHYTHPPLLERLKALDYEIQH